MDQVTNLQYSESWSGTDYYDLLTEGDSEMTSVNESKSFPIPCAVKLGDLRDIKNLVPYGIEKNLPEIRELKQFAMHTPL